MIWLLSDLEKKKQLVLANIVILHIDISML